MGKREERGIWRRYGTPSAPKIVRIVHAVSLKGVGRVPVPVEDSVVVCSYVPSNLTYEYRLFNKLGEQEWLQVLPAGGYASPVYIPERHALWVPFGYSKVAELDAQDGCIRWTIDFGTRVRSAPLFDEESRTYVAANDNLLVRYDAGKVLQQRKVPGCFFFGVPSRSDGMFLSLMAKRTDGKVRNVVTAVDFKSLKSVWETEIGKSSVVSSDTCGIGIDPSGRRAIVSAPPGDVVCLDTHTGEELWRVKLGLTNWRATPEVTRDRVCVGSLEGDLVLLSLNGEIEWRRQLDPLGIWSPPLATDTGYIVHGGTWLWAVSAVDGSVEWGIPIGFDVYTRPVWHNGLINVCGGDPPNDGYLFWIDTRPNTIEHQQSAGYMLGENRDHLTVEREFGQDVEKVLLDLAPFGLSSEEPCRSEGTSFCWEGEVSIDKRWAESVIVGKAYNRTGPVKWFTMWIDTGSSRGSSVAVARVIRDFKVYPQHDVASSGGEVVAALLLREGKTVYPDDVVHAARWMQESRGIDPHHLWRGGAARIYMASHLPLAEMAGEQPTSEAIEDLLSQWEQRGG